MRNYVISVGKSRTELKWERREVSWDTLLARLQNVTRTRETVREYKSLTKAQQGKVKDRGGFVGGALSAPQRKASTIASRSLLTLDIDYGTKDAIAVIDEALDGTAWALYSTHSHTPESPRYRLIVPLDREVTPDEYPAVARRVAEGVGMDLFDDSTYQPERLMYWPTASIDGEYVFESREGGELNADRVLRSYADWKDASQWPVSSRVQKVTVTNGRKQEDPTAKGGVIGAFCRTYGIAAAIETFLSDVYTPAGDGRYTYLHGSSACGMVTYEDKWAYSHHGSDPAGAKLCNAFDLVRIHKFGDLDAEADPDTPVCRMPSFTAMSEFAQNDPETSRELTRARLREISEDYAEALGSEDTPDTEWMEKMQWHNEKTRDYWLASPYNFQLICENDPALKDLVKHDVFRDRYVLQRDTPWMPLTPEHKYWTDADYDGLTCYMSEKYRLQGPGALQAAHDKIMGKTYYHPIRDFFASLPAWDGEKRLDTVLIDYMGADDNVLTRAMTRKHLCAAVARVMDPGIKYDYILTIVGPEGTGKSTICRRLAGEWFCDSFSSKDIGDKSAMEQLRGAWIIELGELKDYKHNTVEAFKAFASKTVDEYRPAYARKKVVIPRQCVFFATTNETNFLKGDTGNRRFWPVEIGVDLPTKDVYNIPDEEILQIWAEALQAYRQGEPLYLSQELEAMARERQQEHNEVEADERIGMIIEYLRRPVSANWYQTSKETRRTAVQNGLEVGEGEPSVRRKYICAMEVIEECLGQSWDRFKAKDVSLILRSIEGLEYVGLKRTDDKVYGVQKRWAVNL